MTERLLTAYKISFNFKISYFKRWQKNSTNNLKQLMIKKLNNYQK